MSKKIKLELTEAQFYCLIDVIDTVSAQTGCLDEDFNKEQNKNVLLLDRMLKNNGYKREHK